MVSWMNNEKINRIMLLIGLSILCISTINFVGLDTILNNKHDLVVLFLSIPITIVFVGIVYKYFNNFISMGLSYSLAFCALLSLILHFVAYKISILHLDKYQNNENLIILTALMTFLIFLFGMMLSVILDYYVKNGKRKFYKIILTPIVFYIIVIFFCFFVLLILSVVVTSPFGG